jgi:peptide-methionine (S)-S-oxide reductase
MTTLSNPAKADSVVLGGGCFWCLDASYKLLPGVTHITCGYSGGTLANPSYRTSAPRDGPRRGGEDRLRPGGRVAGQGPRLLLARAQPDPGRRPGQRHGQPVPLDHPLRRAPQQKAAAEKSRAEAQKKYSDPITTEIVPLVKFWPAEDYHQDYFAKHPDEGYCSVVIRPKVDKLKHMLETEK